MFLLSKHFSVLLPQFLLIFRKSAAGELAEDSGLCVLARLSEIDVSTEGVKGAKTFFEAKVRRLVTPVIFKLCVRCAMGNGPVSLN